MPSWPRFSKTGPNHDTTATMFHQWDKILKLSSGLFTCSLASNFLLENSGFLLATLPCSVLLMGSWTLTLANVRKAFSCLEVTQGTFTTSQTITRSASEWSLLADNLLGKVTVVLNFLRLYTICLTVDLWSPNTLEVVLYPFLAWCATSTLFRRSSVISFFSDMIHFHTNMIRLW